MTHTYIATLYGYTDWANDRMLSAVRPLTEEHLHRDMGNSFASVHATLIHMLVSEWIWLSRWTGGSPTEMPGSDGLDTVRAVRARWSRLESNRNLFIQELDAEAVRRRVSYRRVSGDLNDQPLWEMMCHAANHATYHRGQITTMLRQLGAQAIGTDMIEYLRSDAYDRPKD